MRTFIGTALLSALFLLWYPYDAVDWSVSLFNGLIVVYWMFFYKRYTYLPMLGMVGTLIGLIMAFGVVDVSLLTDTEMVRQMVGSVISGIGVSITTTLTAVLLWLVKKKKNG